MPLAYLDMMGPDGQPQTAVSYPLTGTVVLGREGHIDLSGDPMASRLHAKVEYRDGAFYLEDLGSTNGTFIQLTHRTKLAVSRSPGGEGDVLLIGADLMIRVNER